MKRILSGFIAFVLCLTAFAALSPIAVSAASGPPTSSSFINGTIDSDWTVVRPVTTGDLAYSVEKGLGLKLKTQPAGMQLDPPTSEPMNIFTRPANANSWEAVAKVYFPVAPNANYQQLAFGVYDSDNNYIKVDIEYNSGWAQGRMAQFSINRAGTYTHTHRTYLNNAIFPAEVDANRETDLVVYYKITKTGDTYKASVSFNGVDYVTVGARSGNSGGTNTNGEYTVTYEDPKLFLAAIRDQAAGDAIDTYCEYVKVYNIDGGPSINVLEEEFNDVTNYITGSVAAMPETLNLKVGELYDNADLPQLPGGYSFKWEDANNADDIDLWSYISIVAGKIMPLRSTPLLSQILSVSLVGPNEGQVVGLKTFGIEIEASDAAPTVQFHYNYTNAPAAPASFTKITNDEGKITSFPVEQTLPQAGARPDWGFVGWYTNPEGTGEKVTLDTVYTGYTNLYAKWEQVPSLWKEYEDYFLMGAFNDYGANNAIHEKHYNILCPSNSFKLDGQIGNNNTNSASRQAYNAAIAAINSDDSMTEEEKAAAREAANTDVRLQANRGVVNTLNNMRTHNQNHPEEPKYTRFHVVSWHGGQQPKYFFTNGFTYTNDATSDRITRENPGADGSWASRETMKARLDSYIKALVEAYAPYDDLIVSWDITNEPVDDYTGQIRNRAGDSQSQRGDWGNIWHDIYPATNEDGTLKFTGVRDAMGVIYDPERLYDESEWIRAAFESAAKWFDEYDLDWPLYLNDYMDSNKTYNKLEPTIDILHAIREEVDLKGQKLVYGLQGRLAWAAPTIDTLRKQIEDALEIVDMVGVTEADVRSDFEPNPHWNPRLPMVQVQTLGQNPTPKWTANDLNSGSGSYSNPTYSLLMNTVDTHNSPVRRIPEWGTGNGMSASSERYNAPGFLAISEEVMKKQADFAADWMDILVDNASKVELYQWDGTSDSGTFNTQKGAHMWVNNVTGRSGSFEKYSFFAVIGSPVRDKLEKAIAASPSLADAGLYAGVEAWDAYTEALNTATGLVDKRIYTLEGVNDVKDATAALYAAAATLAETKPLLIYAKNDDSGDTVAEGYAPGASAAVKASVGFVRDGYTFSGWNTKADGTGTAYAGSESIAMAGHVTLFAQWDSSLVKFRSFGDTKSDSGRTEVAAVQVQPGGKVTRPEDPVWPDDGSNYRFRGWYSNLALTEPWDFDTEITEGTRIYAKWAIADYVNFNYGGQAATELTAGETLSIKASYDIDSDAPQTMRIALYDAAGKLLKVSGGNDGIFSDGVIDFNTTFDIPADLPTGATLKVFIWNSETYAPLCAATTF